MVGRRPAGRGRGGAVPVAKRSALQGNKGTGRCAVSATNTASESLSALVQSERNHRREATAVAITASSGVSGEEDVTLLYRKPRTRQTKQLGSDGLAEAATPAKLAGADVSTTAANLTAAGSTSEEEVMAFCQRACSDVNRLRALSSCGVLGEVSNVAVQGGASALSQEQLLNCSVDRMETARRALHNLNDLLYTPSDTTAAAGAPCIGYPCWVRPEQYAAVVALARVCEAAVPMQLPSMLRLCSCPAALSGQGCVSSEGVRSATARKSAVLWTLPITAAGARTKGAAVALLDAAAREVESARVQEDAAEAEFGTQTLIDLIPSPVLFADVQKRYRCLRRLHELQVAYGRHIPAFRAASTFEDLRHLFFAHDATACQLLGRMCQTWRDGSYPATFTTDEFGYGHPMPQSNVDLAGVLKCFLGSPLVLDTLLPFVGITARYPQEEALVQSYITALKDTTTMEAASWGPMAATSSWRCTDGLYVVHHASRVHALRRLLNEAQLYGLPLFLRSIRAMGGDHVGCGSNSAGGVGGWHHATALKRVQCQYADQFFLTPDCLDPDLFSQPDPMQAQLVQEELVTLQRTNCAFCLVVGEADEVLTLVHQHMRYHGNAWQQRIKKEEVLSPASVSAVSVPPQNDRRSTDEDVAEKAFFHSIDESGTASVKGSSPVTRRLNAPTDPLRFYAIRTVDAARRQQKSRTSSASPSVASPPPFSHVQWIERGGRNRWSYNSNYYGLSYMVVLETEEDWATESGGVLATEGLLPETAIAMSETTDTAALRQVRVPAFCVNAMLQLWHT